MSTADLARPESVRSTHPRLVVSTVIRSAHKGDSHGSVYLVDMGRGTTEKVIDCDTPDIDWSGSGGERGLRGIAFHGERMYLATHNEVIGYDRDFRIIDRIGNPYFGQLHEIVIDGDRLWITSTSFDSVLCYDLSQRRFVHGVCLRSLGFHRKVGRIRKFVRRVKGKLDLPDVPRLSLHEFDPESERGPVRCDEYHINNIHVADGTVYISPGRYHRFLAFDGNRLVPHAKIPLGTHNTRPFRDGILYSDTKNHRIVYADREGRRLREFQPYRHDPSDLANANLPNDIARPCWARGLCVTSDGKLVGGVSPATVSLYDLEDPRPIQSVNISRDVRHAIHGLEVWPY